MWKKNILLIFCPSVFKQVGALQWVLSVVTVTMHTVFPFLISVNQLKSARVPHRFLWSSSTMPRSFCHVWKAHTKWRESAETRCSKSLSQRLWRKTTSSFAQPRFLKITWRGPSKERTREWIWAVWFYTVPYKKSVWQKKINLSSGISFGQISKFYDFLNFFLKRGLLKPLAEIYPGLNHTHWQALEQKATLKTRNMSPGNTWQDLSKSPGSAVHSCWRSPVQGGIATTVEHMLFVETPESVSSFLFPPLRLLLSRPRVCSSH